MTLNLEGSLRLVRPQKVFFPISMKFGVIEIGKKLLWTDERTDGRTDGHFAPLMLLGELRGVDLTTLLTSRDRWYGVSLCS